MPYKTKTIYQGEKRMLTDPQTITIDSVPFTLNRVTMGDLRGIYQDATDEHKLTVSHQLSKGRARRMVRLDTKAIVADPLTAVNDYENLGVYVVIDEPEVGFTDADIADIVAGLFAWFNAAMVAKVLSSQS